jgi:hypothetical protein
MIKTGEVRMCPQMLLKFGKLNLNAVIGTGSQMSVLSKEVYDQLILQGLKMEELLVQSTVIISAF